jgi:hypothetical protein
MAIVVTGMRNPLPIRRRRGQTQPPFVEIPPPKRRLLDTIRAAWE